MREHCSSSRSSANDGALSNYRSYILAVTTWLLKSAESSVKTLPVPANRLSMFAAASAKEDANPKLCHTISVWPPTGPPSIAGWVPDTTL